MGRDAIILTAIVVMAGSARAGTTRCWIDQGAVVAAASFGDIAGDFIIDLGAPVSELHVTRANADGIESESAIRSLSVAGRRIADVRMTVADLDALPQTDTSIAGDHRGGRAVALSRHDRVRAVPADVGKRTGVARGVASAGQHGRRHADHQSRSLRWRDSSRGVNDRRYGQDRNLGLSSDAIATVES